MTHDADTTVGAPIAFDNWRTIAFAVFMALVGYSVMVTVPVLSTALVQSLSFTEDQVGRVWGNDIRSEESGETTCLASRLGLSLRHFQLHESTVDTW